MFQSAPSDIIEDLSTKNITSNFHRYCLTEQVIFLFNVSIFSVKESYILKFRNKGLFKQHLIVR